LTLAVYRSAVRPLLFALPPSSAHALAMAAMGPVEHIPWLRTIVTRLIAPPEDERIAVHALGLRFPSPVGLAAGFDKNGRRPLALAALGFGHIEIGTVTALPQKANPSPNLFRLTADRALVNRLGFPNEGAERVAARLAAARSSLRVPVGISIGKSRAVAADDVDAVVADYMKSFERVRSVADFVVVNVSSPNTVGLRTMQTRQRARELLGALAAGGGPQARLLLKMAPDLGDAELEELLEVVEETRFAGVVATNTTVERVGLASDSGRIQTVGAGGLSGPPLRARAIDVVARVRARLGRKVLVIGVGGVESATDALALLRAGADLVQMYTGLVYEGPAAPARVARGLLDVVVREGLNAVSDLVGTASPPRRP
jgi:dihydroorotate dehydrogenase